MRSLNNQRLLVLGGSSGIGFATAARAIDEGATVTIASRSQAKLDKALVELGANVNAAALDTGDQASLERFFADNPAWEHVVVTAAEMPRGSVRSLSVADAKAAMESKFWGAYRVARVAKIEDGGSLTLISGFRSERPSASSGVQSAINAALEGLARGLALELAPVRVNAVSPGLIASPLWAGMAAEDREQMYERAAQNLPVGRVGEPDDIANAVMFVLANSYATGSTIRVDGGGAIA